MPSLKDAPPKLKPYLQHRVELDYERSGEPKGVCPFCLKEDYFIARDTGLYSCKHCVGPDGKSGGNIFNFIRWLHSVSLESTTDEDYGLVAEDRKLPPEVLKEWGLCKSVIDKEWLLPAYGFKSEINNLYRWAHMKGKRRLIATADMPTCLFGYQFWDPNKPNVYLNEGAWDGMTMRHRLMLYGLAGGKLVRVSSVEKSLYATTNVLAVPGCETFKEDWLTLFKGKNVTMFYHNDFPRRTKERVHPPAGTTGMKTAAKKLKKVARSMSYIDWGEEGYDPTLNDGYDVRDILTTEDAETTTEPV